MKIFEYLFGPSSEERAEADRISTKISECRRSAEGILGKCQSALFIENPIRLLTDKQRAEFTAALDSATYESLLSTIEIDRFPEIKEQYDQMTALYEKARETLAESITQDERARSNFVNRLNGALVDAEVVDRDNAGQIKALIDRIGKLITKGEANGVGEELNLIRHKEALYKLQLEHRALLVKVLGEPKRGALGPNAGGARLQPTVYHDKIILPDANANTKYVVSFETHSGEIIEVDTHDESSVKNAKRRGFSVGYSCIQFAEILEFIKSFSIKFQARNQAVADRGGVVVYDASVQQPLDVRAEVIELKGDGSGPLTIYS
ncbi:MAG: hypothetical protein OEY44_00255 [Candidatus Peregrinibacteria bacterium]|nr:hypothetical protein [Candidatus Peregrinibacteria bacterium]